MRVAASAVIGGVLLATALVVPALAQAPRAAEGVVLRVDAQEVIVDLGLDDGVPAGATVQVYRRLEVTHPVTRRVVVDRFPIGAVELAAVGRHLSIIRGASDLQRPPAVGDFVVWTPAEVSPEVVDPRTDPREAGLATAPDAATAALDQTFHATLGRELAQRVTLWEEYVAAFPQSPHLAAVGQELEWLRRRLAEERERKVTPAVPPKPVPLPVQAFVTLPQAVEVGQPLEVAVTATTPPEEVAAMRLLIRRQGEPGFTTLALAPDGERTWRARLDPSWVAPGVLEAVVETARADGELQVLSGTTAHPLPIAVSAPVRDPEPSADRSRASAVVDDVDFEAGAGDDAYLRLGADFRYVVDAGVLAAFRMGAGVFEGSGNSLAAMAAHQPSRSVGLGYGFAEAELHLAPIFGVALQLMAGNAQGGSGTPFESAFGFRGELRFGEPLGTRLLVGAAFTQQIGNEAWIEVAFDALPDVPMSGAVVVTNLPVGEDLGVSLVYGAGYRFNDLFSLMGRVGFNARTIDHTGFTLGAAALFNW
ncbi:MAG: hypothetical protein U1F43_09295 [Myxococcota bacterium]